MPLHNISAQVSEADLQAIKDAVNAIRQKLPFMTVLSNDERRSLFKMGDQRMAFVQNARGAAENNPDIFPRSFSVPEFAKDVELTSTLREVRTVVSQLASDIDDTTMAVGSEAANAAAKVYEYVKAAADSSPGLKPVAEQLGEAFKRAGSAKPAVAPGPQPS